MPDFKIGDRVTYHRKGKDGSVPTIGGPATVRCIIKDIILEEWCDMALTTYSSIPVPLEFLSHD